MGLNLPYDNRILSRFLIACITNKIQFWKHKQKNNSKFVDQQWKCPFFETSKIILACCLIVWVLNLLEFLQKFQNKKFPFVYDFLFGLPQEKNLKTLSEFTTYHLEKLSKFLLFLRGNNYKKNEIMLLQFIASLLLSFECKIEYTSIINVDFSVQWMTFV